MTKINKEQQSKNVHLHNEAAIYELLNLYLPENYANEAGRRLMVGGLGVVGTSVIRNIRNGRNSPYKNQVLAILVEMANEEKAVIQKLNKVKP